MSIILHNIIHCHIGTHYISFPTKGTLEFRFTIVSIVNNYCLDLYIRNHKRIVKEFGEILGRYPMLDVKSVGSKGLFSVFLVF